MAELEIEPGEILAYRHRPAARPGALSFVFANPLLEDSALWEAGVAEGVAAEGYGALSFDYRGVGASKSRPQTVLDPELVAADLARLAASALEEPPVFVGVGFGGRIAARAVIGGAPAAGLVLINSLMEVGERLDWVNHAAPLIYAEGGEGLYREALLPLLVGAEYLEAQRRAGGLAGGLAEAYAPPPEGDGKLRLLKAAAEADWRLELAALTAPTLVISCLEDRVFLDREVVNRQFAELPDARAEAWEDAGHLAPAERPDQMARSLVRFAREIEEEAA